ncbi:PiggyBac transposable element-derived protein 4 [Dictyocoela muelleri]|nr:PiggyBac transposable element-derived protein 4 [Dictyocoela muelleri]
MSLKRFSEINSNITCVSQKDYPDESTRKIINEPKIFKLIYYKFSISYCLGKNISIDESIIPFKGCTQIKVYNPRKPTRYGIKIYMLSDSQSSYIYNLRVYSIPSIIKDTILVLTRELEEKYHRIYMENLYNSFVLCTILYMQKFYVCGTLRNNRGRPNDLKNIKKCSSN